MAICSATGCNKPAKSLGWCGMHYMRLRRHGDTSVQKTPANGDASRFYREVVLPYDGDECLTWPFSCDSKGYAKMWIEDDDGTKCRIVSRMLCVEVNGEPPTPEHHAAHTCHKGHLACVTKRHIEWQTPQKNRSDRPRLARNHLGKFESAEPAGGKIISLAAVR